MGGGGAGGCIKYSQFQTSHIHLVIGSRHMEISLGSLSISVCNVINHLAHGKKQVLHHRIADSKSRVYPTL